MIYTTKNKLLTGLVLLLLVANVVTITLFWVGKARQPFQQRGTPAEYLIKELTLNEQQQLQLELLRKEHRNAVEPLRQEVKEAKKSFFDLLKQKPLSDSVLQIAIKHISALTEQLDLITFHHFQKVRAICTTEQQKRFDEILGEVTRMINQPRPPMGPPAGGPDGNMPPPPVGPEERPAVPHENL
jgi:hypothetical protein